MRLFYLDTCCYGRPRDDLTVARNRAEARAVKAFIWLCRSAGHIIIGSPMVKSEILENPDSKGRNGDLRFFRRVVNRYIDLTDGHFSRADDFIKKGLGAKDSVHLAVAESVNATALVTVDDDFLRIANNRASCAVTVINPLVYNLGGIIWPL